MSAKDTQVGGDHYKRQAIQPIEYITANGLGYMAGNIIKYATRAGHKGNRDDMRADIRKIAHYAELWLDSLAVEDELTWEDHCAKGFNGTMSSDFNVRLDSPFHTAEEINDYLERLNKRWNEI